MACDISDSIEQAGLEPTALGLFKLNKAIYGKLCEILLQYDSMASCDIKDSIERAGCCVTESPFQLQKAIFGKLCEINDSISGAQPTCIVCHDHDPVDGVDVPPCNCSLWVTDKGDVSNLWRSSDGVTWKIVGTYWP